VRFRDQVVERLDLGDAQSVCKLITEHLCASPSSDQLDQFQRDAVEALWDRAANDGLIYEQFNELLLVLNQDRISRAFFDFFLAAPDRPAATAASIPAGVGRYRGFAMLCFGGFRRAFQELRDIPSRQALLETLHPYSRDSKKLEESLKNRGEKPVRIDPIVRDDTWFVGELTTRKLKADLEQMASAQGPILRDPEFRKFREDLEAKADQYERVQAKALHNNKVYLSWDFLDVYIATSMRCEWEFKETHDFVQDVFTARPVRDLHLRYFDPTQCKCANTRDKGLVEGLMLKRASCTIYMAQETDTLGKDSELAATLAQGHPVIVYVPQIRDPGDMARRIRGNPLEYFYRRFLTLKAEEVFDVGECHEAIAGFDPSYRTTINQFISEYEDYKDRQPYALWRARDDRLRESLKYFDKLCGILARAEMHAFDARANILKGKHPLAMQVDLQSGVAVGVIVVRSATKCARALRQLLLNEAEFEIREIDGQDKDDPGYTILEEAETKSQFRVVTRNRKLANSFWNLFGARTSDAEEPTPQVRRRQRRGQHDER
jgi:hypothetical protein